MTDIDLTHLAADRDGSQPLRGYLASPDDFSHVIGVQTIGSSCAGAQPYAMAILPDDYLVACFPFDAGSDQLAGQGSTWQIYHP
jgi:hypothetical protein